MVRTRSLSSALAWSVVCALAFHQPLAGQIDARALRQPDVSATQIAFVFAGDVWVVPKAGGVANRLSSPRGEESFPRFSPDGKLIAFTGDYDGMPPQVFEKVKKTLRIRADRVETVTPFLAEGALKTDKSGARVEWLTKGKAARRFATAKWSKRDPFLENQS